MSIICQNCRKQHTSQMIVEATMDGGRWMCTNPNCRAWNLASNEWPYKEMPVIQKSDIGKKGSALDTQIGGSHYKDFPIQPIVYSFENELNFIQADVVKRMTRYNHPTGKGLEDLLKSKHEIDVLIELEGYENDNT